MSQCDRKSRQTVGRPSNYHPEVGQDIADAMATGLSLEAAAAACGIGPRTAFTWQQQHEEFRQLESMEAAMVQYSKKACHRPPAACCPGFGGVVRTDVLGHAPKDEQIGQNVDDIRRFQLSVNPDRRRSGRKGYTPDLLRCTDHFTSGESVPIRSRRPADIAIAN